MKQFWAWIDVQPFAIPREDTCDITPLNKRIPWWELMVEWLLDNYGQLSLV